MTQAGTKENFVEPEINVRLLSPLERVSEILFGLIMALTFTCTFKVVEADKAEVKDMLFAALGCNVVWGVADGVFYILMGLTMKSRGLTILRFIRNSKDPVKSREFIKGELPPLIASVIDPIELDNIGQRLLKLENLPGRIPIHKNDLKGGIGVFFLVFLSTLPVAVPFVFISNDRTALRISNMIAIIMMFICGWILGRYAGRNPWISGLFISGIGIVLVLLAIYLGG